MAGAKAVADLGGKGELGVIGLQGYKIVQEYDTGFYREVRATCPACTIKETDLPLTSLGTTDGTDIVNFLRANPGIKGLLLGYDGLGSDLFTAAKSAGITLPKVYSIATLPTGVQAAQEGELTATVPVDYTDLGWRDADALARIFTGQTASALTQDVLYERPVIWSDAVPQRAQPALRQRLPGGRDQHPGSVREAVGQVARRLPIRDGACPVAAYRAGPVACATR